MKNILTLAEKNADALNRSHHKIQTDKTDAFRQFLSKNKEFSITTLKGFTVQKGKESINWEEFSGIPTASRILQSGRYLNNWEVNPGNPSLHFGGRVNQRTKFDNSFENGKKFKYLAITAGTSGLPHWGDVTLVLREKEFKHEEFVILKFNSLEKDGSGFLYFTGGNVNYQKIEGDLCTKAQLEKLAVWKLCDKVKACKAEEFKNILLLPLTGNHNDYLEVITWKDIFLSECLKAIRLKKDHYRIISDTIQKQFRERGNTRNQTSLKNLISFNNLLTEYAGNKNIKLDLVNE